MKINEIGSWIAERRCELGISKAELCRRLGYSIVTAGVWEGNKSLPRVGAVADMLDYFGYECLINGKVVDLYDTLEWLDNEIQKHCETTHQFYRETGLSVGHLYYGEGQTAYLTLRTLFRACEYFGYEIEFVKKVGK